jgi:hypothetical protein
MSGYSSFSYDLPKPGKALCITSIQLNISITAVDPGSYVAIMDGESNTILWKTGLLRSESNDFQFSSPLIFKKSTLGMTPNGFTIIFMSNLSIINKGTINLQGFLEDLA